MKQFVYSYERVVCSFSDWGPFNGNAWETQNHRELIDQKARQGWRYAGYIPVIQRGTGHISEMDLIFEKEAE